MSGVVSMLPKYTSMFSLALLLTPVSNFRKNSCWTYFGLQSPREGVVFDQFHEPRVLERPVLLLIVHKDGFAP